VGQSFNSKIDWWLAGILILASVVLVAVGSLQWRDGGWAIGFAPIMIALFVIPCRYELREDQLVVRCGIVRYLVPYPSIDMVTPSRNPISSPALSLDRLEIRYGKKLILISPLDKEGFLQALAGVTPRLRLVNDRLIPRT
jgi:membrane protein YdbS with pleckstrin-like domain